MPNCCLLYARFSTEQQNPVGCRDQLRECRAHAARRSWRVLREYSDEAISGAVGEGGRSGWAALLHDVRAGLLPRGGRVLVWSISRWSRDFRDGMIAALELDRFGVILADCTGKEYDLSDIAGTINLTVEQHKAASFLSELRLAVKRGMAAKREEGYWTGTPPYGYVIVRDYQARRSTLAPHPEQADVVRRIFRELADGASPTQVARDLGRAGIPAARGGAWHPATVRNIACNPTYRGLIVHYADGQRGGRRFNGATVTAQPGRHPALVDETTWHFARSRLPGEGDARRKCRARQWPLAGLLHCAACGKRMVVSGGRLPYRYFRCRPYGQETGCPSERLVPILAAEAAVAAWVERLARNRRQLRRAAVTVQRLELEARTATRRAQEPMRQRLAEIASRQARLLAAIEASEAPAPATALARLAELDAEAAAVQRELARVVPAGEPLPVAAIEAALTDLVRGGGDPRRWRDLIDRIDAPPEPGAPLRLAALGEVWPLPLERAAKPAWWAPRGAVRRS